MDYFDPTEGYTVTYRIIYSYKPEKPNDHCVWQCINCLIDLWAWVENDEHYKERIKKGLK